MEDLATDRIYRLMIAQRTMHSDAVEIVDETGKIVRHTAEFSTRLFDEELERLLGEGLKENDQAATARLREARKMSEEMIHRGEFDPA
jgi:malate synthase